MKDWEGRKFEKIILINYYKYKKYKKDKNPRKQEGGDSLSPSDVAQQSKLYYIADPDLAYFKNGELATSNDRTKRWSELTGELTLELISDPQCFTGRNWTWTPGPDRIYSLKVRLIHFDPFFFVFLEYLYKWNLF